MFSEDALFLVKDDTGDVKCSDVKCDGVFEHILQQQKQQKTDIDAACSIK